MNQSDLIDTILLCTVNVLFMLAGIFLNCAVIASVWTSLQLRKKPCYFMILVLSCFDLAVVTVTHPLIISAAVKLSHEDDIYYRVKRFIAVRLHGWSTLALFMMTVERFLGLTYPFFHRIVGRPTVRKMLEKKFDGIFVLEAGNLRKNIV